MRSSDAQHKQAQLDHGVSRCLHRGPLREAGGASSPASTLLVLQHGA